MNRRNFIRAAPAAAALAPSVLKSSASGTLMQKEMAYNSEKHLGFSQMHAVPVDQRSWLLQRKAEIQALLDGKDRPSARLGRDSWAANLDALRSVSAVNKHRLMAERECIHDMEMRKTYALQEMTAILRDLAGLK